MNGHLTLTATNFSPYMLLNDNDNHNCAGLNCNLINYLSSSMNFTYDFIKYTKKGSFKLPNGSWTGPIGLIQREVSEINKINFYLD